MTSLFKTLLSILADLNNAVVWMVFTCLHFSKSLSSFTNPLVIVLRAPITIDITVTFMFHSFFNSLARSRYLFVSLSFNFTLWSAGTAKFTILQVLFFLVEYYKVWSSGWNLVICCDLKIPEVFVRLILLDRFWIVDIPFVRMVKFQFLAQFPVDHLVHPIASCLILFLC